ncbi:hypothetical protein [Glutamicibacter sp.]|uniref:hypothetical protein n=1 Tax=Glutamicibacter sp. TaxID=1931995 RepID=UPI0028BD7032|nr:hypothetical protein [Glutamicibacter sp.]
MRKVLPSAVLLSLVLLTASGCTNFDAAATSPVSSECSAAIQDQNASWQDKKAFEEEIQGLEIKSLQACKNLDEWATAVSYNPGSMGYEVLNTEEAANLVYLPCQGDDPENETPVCADAAGRGYLD